MLVKVLRKLKRYGITLPIIFNDESDLRKLMDNAGDRGIIADSQREMMQSVLDLGDTLVRELMVPRTDIVWIEGNRTLRQGLSLALRSGFTRIPVIAENLDDVIGIAYVKDLARRVHEHHDSEQSETVAEHLRPASFIPENKTAADLLKEMQRNQTHMAIVIDEYGGMAGLVTLEDIVEEIVGEIRDEYDQSEELLYQQVSPDEYIIQGRIDLDDLNKVIGTHLTKEIADTLGGFIYSEVGRIPAEGEQVNVEDWILTVEKVNGRRIHLVRACRQAQGS